MEAQNEAKPIKIFSMEADEFFKIFLRDALVIYSSCKTDVSFASSVNESLEMLKKDLPNVPDIIFLCLAAPLETDGKTDMLGGFKVLKFLRENDIYKNVPIIMFSKYNEEGLKKKAKNLGATKYLVKGECMPKDISDIVTGDLKVEKFEKHLNFFEKLFTK